MDETFNPVAPLNDTEECSFARHFHAQAAKDLLYFLEYKTRTNPRRFVWVWVDSIPVEMEKMLHGRRRKQQLKPDVKTPGGDRRRKSLRRSHGIIDKYIKLFRELGIITVRFKGKDFRGVKQMGFQMMRHDDLTRRTPSGCCEWIGLNMPPESYDAENPEPQLRRAWPIGARTPHGEWPVTFHNEFDREGKLIHECKCHECQDAKERSKQHE